jgi:hypothetical protein
MDEEEEQMRSRFRVSSRSWAWAVVYSQPQLPPTRPCAESVEGVPVPGSVPSVITVQAMQENLAVTADLWPAAA